MVAVDRVPVEILLSIFNKLEFEDSLNILLVNKKWRDIQVSSRFFKRRVLVKIDGSLSLTKFVEVFTRSTRDFDSLKIEKVCFGDKEEVIDLLSFLHQSSFNQQIKNLTIFQCTFKDHSIFNMLINSFNNCEAIHIEGNELLDHNCSYRSPQWNKLMQLNFDSNKLKPVKQLKQQQKQTNELKKLTFLYSTNELLTNLTNYDSLEVLKLCLLRSPSVDQKIFIDQQALKLLAGNSKTLHKLDLYEIYIDDQFLENLARIKFEKLGKFSMSNAFYLQEERAVGWERFIIQNENLEKFKTNCLLSIDGPKIEFLLKHEQKLKSLNLILSSSCNQSHFKDFHNLQKLEKLTLQPSQCSQTYGEIIQLITSYQNNNLKILRLFLTKFNLKIVQNIIENFKNLEVLDFSSGISMRTTFVYLLLEKLKKLKHFKIDDCQFSDSSQFILIRNV